MDYYIKNKILDILGSLFFRTFEKKSIRRIIVFRTGSLGDGICALPAINEIAGYFEDATIDLVSNPGRGSVTFDSLVCHPRINCIKYDSVSKLELVKLLKSKKYDLFIELPQDAATLKTQVRNMLFAKIIGAKYGFGWEIAATKLFIKTQADGSLFVPEAKRLIKILQKNGIPAEKQEYKLCLGNNDILKADELLKSQNDKLIVLAPGAKRSTNRWSIQKFNTLKELLISNGFWVALIGGIEDQEFVKPMLCDGVIDLTGKLSVMESAAVIKKSILAITNDSGPMHLSYAVGTPVIAIFSCRDYPIKWYPPLDEKNFVFRLSGIECECCFLEECPYDNKCTEAILVDEVYGKAVETIERLGL